MSYTKLTFKFKSGLLVAGGFLFFIVLIKTVTQSVPVLGNLVYLGAQMGNPLIFLGLASGTIKKTATLSNIHILMLWGHYIVSGFIIGYVFPVQTSINFSFFKATFFRFCLFFWSSLVVGIVIITYAGLHD